MNTQNLLLDELAINNVNHDLLQLSLVASSNDNGVVFNNADGAILGVNESFCGQTGYTPDEIIGRSTLGFCRKDLTRDSVLQNIAKPTKNKGTILQPI